MYKTTDRISHNQWYSCNWGLPKFERYCLTNFETHYNSETAWFYSSIDIGDSTDSGTTSGGGNSGQGKKKTYQRVEILKIAEPCPLIDPSQVVVTQGEILRADPVLTPIGTFWYCVLNSLVTFKALFLTTCLSAQLTFCYHLFCLQCKTVYWNQ